MHAAREAAEPPFEILDRPVRAAGRRVEADVQNDPARREDPEQQEAERAEVAQRIGGRAERAIEHALAGDERLLNRGTGNHLVPPKNR